MLSSSTHTIVYPQSHGGDDLINLRRNPTEQSRLWCHGSEMLDNGLIDMHPWFSHRLSLHSLLLMWLQLPLTRRNSDK